MSVRWRFRDWPLRGKMAALLGSALLLPLLGTLSTTPARDKLLEDTATLLGARGDQLAVELDAFNRNYQRAVARLARSEPVVAWCTTTPGQAAELGSQMRAILDAQPMGGEEVRGVGLLDTAGRVTLATEAALVGVDFSRRRYVRAALGGQAVISDLHMAEPEVGSVPTIAYVSPVFGPDGRLAGVAAFWVRASALWDLAHGSNELAGPGSFAVLYDRHGIRIGHTFSDQTLFRPAGELDARTIAELAAEQRFGERTAELLADVQPFPHQFECARAEQPDTSMFHGFAPSNQKNNFGVARRLHTTDWTLSYMLPEDAFLAASSKVVRDRFMLVGLVVFVALVIGALFSAVILDRLRALSRATAELAEGHLTARAEPGGRDELGLLAASFNTMAGRIQSQDAALRRARDELELRVQERTADLLRTSQELEAQVTERRRGDERNRAILESALDAIIAMNHEGAVVEFNPAAERIFGYRRADVLGRQLEDVIIPPDLRAAHRQGLAMHLATGRGPVLGQRLELTGLRADGTLVPVEVSITRMPGSGPPMFTGFARDITERRRAENALRESEESLATTLDSIGDAVISTDLQGRVVRMNPVAEELTGWVLAEARGRQLSEVFHILNEDSREVVESPADRVLREGVVVGLANHTALVARDGSERPIADSGAPIRDAQGAISGVVLVFRDQSEERRAEAERARSLELEAQSHRVQEASRLKSEFLANMSHELRTPLNAIIGFAQLLHDERIKAGMPEYEEALGDILSSGRHLLQLINDVLDLSKVEAGMMQFRPEPVDLSRLVREVLGILRTTIAEKRIHVEAHVDPSLDGIELDAGRFKQVLYNYVSNALKFTPEEGRVVVRALPERDPALFRLEVEDTGIGIAPEDLSRLFLEFQQLDAGAAKRHGGTGLGLALTRRLVEAQGGSVGVRSTPGVGSAFHAVLPRASRVGTPMPAPVGPTLGRPNVPTVLVVDDNERDQALLVRTLVGAGYVVDAASNGAQAVEFCRKRTYDAITLDLLLPDMSGLDVLRTLRDEGGQREVPVIVVTVVTEKGSVAGFAVHDILPKPLDSGMLLASLRRARVEPQRTGTVLVVDDDAASRNLMSGALSRLGYAALCVPGAAEGLAAAAQVAPLAVILDLLMPGLNGFEFLDRFRLIESCRRVPVVVWTVKDLTEEEHARLRETVRAVVSKDGGSHSSVIDELALLLPQAPLAAGSAEAGNASRMADSSP